MLITLWLYATTMGEGSARKVCRLCTSDDGYRWICWGISMNYHSLADFRVNHADARDKLFMQVIARLVNLGLIDIHRQQRASTIETVNADFKTHRGLEHIQVRGMAKVKTVVTWAGVACNLMHYGKSLLN